MSKSIFVPKELIFEYARGLSANALLVYICILERQGDYENSVNIVAISKKEISEFTGIAITNLTAHLAELKKAELLEELSDDDLSDEFVCNPYDKIFDLKLNYDNCMGGFIQVPKYVMTLQEVETDDKPIKLKAQHKILYILHMILSEREGYSYAGRKYLADTLGISERTITNLNNTLEAVGLMNKQSELIPLGNEGVKTNNKYYLTFKPLIIGDENRYYEGKQTYRPKQEIVDIVTDKKYRKFSMWNKAYALFQDSQDLLRQKRLNGIE